MAKSQVKKKSQNIRYIAFGVLIVALGAVLYYNLRDDTPAAPSIGNLAQANPGQSTNGRIRNSDLTPGNDPYQKKDDIVKTSSNSKDTKVITAEMVQPIKMDLLHQPMKTIDEPTDGRGNIFNYWVEPPRPPTPPPPPPPPPPVTVSGIQPANVYARTGTFTLRVFGEKFQPDSQVLIGGAPFKTKFISDKELSVEVPTPAIQVPGERDVEVASKVEGFKNSSHVRFTIIPPPTPPYRYVGLIVNGGDSLAVLLLDDNAINVRIGDKVDKNGHWVVRSINDKRIEFEDTQLRLLHAVPFTGEK